MTFVIVKIKMKVEDYEEFYSWMDNVLKEMMEYEISTERYE